MKKAYLAPIAIGTLMPFGAVALINPKEAVDSSHTHVELPAEPPPEPPALINTHSGTAPTLSFHHSQDKQYR